MPYLSRVPQDLVNLDLVRYVRTSERGDLYRGCTRGRLCGRHDHHIGLCWFCVHYMCVRLGCGFGWLENEVVELSRDVGGPRCRHPRRSCHRHRQAWAWAEVIPSVIAAERRPASFSEKREHYV